MSNPVVFSKPCKGGCGMPLYWNQRAEKPERDESFRSDYCPDCEHATKEQ